MGQETRQNPGPTPERKGRSSGTNSHLASLGARVLRAQRGDPQALDALVRSFQSMAVGYAASLLGDTNRAEDVAQEAMVEALRRLPSLKVPEAFPGLLQALVRKHCDRLTRRRYLPIVSLEDALAIAITGADPMNQVQMAATREIVQQAVRDLPLPERTVVLLFYVGGQSHQQIADTLGLPVSTIKSRLHEARGRLKRRMSMLNDDSPQEERPSRQVEKVVKKKYIPEPSGERIVKKKYLQESG